MNKTDLLNSITVSECSKLSESEIINRNCPNDNTAGHTEYILERINSGHARALEIKRDGIKIGFAIYEVYKSRFWVLTMRATFPVDLDNIVLPYLEQLARERNCKTIRFKTVRSGLIKRAINNGGFKVSSVELYKEL